MIKDGGRDWFYLDVAVTGAVSRYHATLAAALVGHVDAGARALGRAAGFLDAALDVVGVVRAEAREIEARGHAVGGGLAGAFTDLSGVVSGCFLKSGGGDGLPRYRRKSQLSVRREVEGPRRLRRLRGRGW